MKAYPLIVEWKETDLENDEHPSFMIYPGVEASSVAAGVSLPHDKDKWYWVSSSFVVALDSPTGQRKGEPSRCAHGFDTPAAAEDDARRSIKDSTLLREVDKGGPEEGQMPRTKQTPLMAVSCSECGYEVCVPLDDLTAGGETPLCPCKPGGTRMGIGGQGPCDNQGPDGRCLGHGRPGGPN